LKEDMVNPEYLIDCLFPPAQGCGDFLMGATRSKSQ
jgi:hypothetical protein